MVRKGTRRNEPRAHGVAQLKDLLRVIGQDQVREGAGRILRHLHVDSPERRDARPQRLGAPMVLYAARVAAKSP